MRRPSDVPALTAAPRLGHFARVAAVVVVVAALATAWVVAQRVAAWHAARQVCGVVGLCDRG